MVETFKTLSSSRQDQVRAAVLALECAERPLPAAMFPALAEAPLRHVVEDVLEASGRVLITSGGGFTSGYADDMAERLADEGLGILAAADRAVLTIVMIFSVAIPRARGELPSDAPWTAGQPVPDILFKDSMIQDVDATDAIRRLRRASLLIRVPGKGLLLGDQFHRLTKLATTLLFEQLIVLADPRGSLAESIRRQRERGGDETSPLGGVL